MLDSMTLTYLTEVTNGELYQAIARFAVFPEVEQSSQSNDREMPSLRDAAQRVHHHQFLGPNQTRDVLYRLSQVSKYHSHNSRNHLRTFSSQRG